jgi:deoxyribonuclease (pyrimidine dimer)
MTRINAGIPPHQLTRQHLIAEHREIKRVPNVIKSGRFTMVGQPKEFTLGTGHVKFFYDKLAYLKERYHEIYLECCERGYNVTYYGNAWDNIPKKYMNNYQPTLQAKTLIEERIKERLNK